LIVLYKNFYLKKTYINFTARKCYECSSTDDDNLCKPGEAIPDDVIPVDCPYGYDFCKV